MSGFKSNIYLNGEEENYVGPKEAIEAGRRSSCIKIREPRKENY